ncbi:MAG: hypothetical protein V4579_13555 [Pseudomonadota bacterium]
MNLFRKTIAAVALGAAALTTAAPAMADGWRGRHRGGGGDDAAIAIGAGVVGLALGAAIASSGGDRYDDRDYYYYDRAPRYRQNYYYYRDTPRYRYRDRHYRDHYRGYDRGWHHRGYRDGYRRHRDDRRYYGRGW